MFDGVLTRPVFLVGFMCSGKSTLGQSVADALGCEFIDLDEFIENHNGCSISEIFESKGESEFRRLEGEALREITSTKGPNAIIALGGGTPCVDGVMETLNRIGITVYLRAPHRKLVERLIEGADKRPLAAGKTPEQLERMVNERMALREPFYLKAVAVFDSSLLEDIPQIAQSTRRFINEILNIH